MPVVRRNVVVVANPAAGGVRGRARVERFTSLLAVRGARPELVWTAAPRFAGDDLAWARGRDLVVAAGGDGTLRDLVDALGREGVDVPVGFFPAGTANVFALEAGLPAGDAALADFLLSAPPVPFRPGVGRFAGDDGRPQERLFMLMAGAGFDARVTGAVDHRLKRWHGRGAYVLAGTLLLLAGRREGLRILADGEELEGDMAVAAVSRFYGGSFSLVPGAARSGPGLSLAVIRRVTPSTLPSLLLAAARRRPDRSGNTLYREALEIRVVNPGVPVQMDGDTVGTTPAEFRRAASPVAVVAGGEHP